MVFRSGYFLIVDFDSAGCTNLCADSVGTCIEVVAICIHIVVTFCECLLHSDTATTGTIQQICCVCRLQSEIVWLQVSG